MYEKILKSLTIVKLYRGMSKVKVEINVNLPQLMCVVVSVALNGEFERFGGFCVQATLKAGMLECQKEEWWNHGTAENDPKS